MIWFKIGESEPGAFYEATINLVKSTQILLFTSGFLFAVGVLTPIREVHGLFMVAGLLAFYHSVMYVQLPGFINAVPHRLVTWILTALFYVGVALTFFIGYVAYLPYATLHFILYLRGLWGKPTYYPNIITAVGLLLLPISKSPIEAVFSFPLASVYSLLYRIDASRAGRKFTAGGAAAITAAYIAAFAAVKLGFLWAVLIPSLLLTVIAPPRIGDKYGIGAFIFRWLIGLAPLSAHLAYMAFAIIMSALCVPYFLGAILYRQLPSYGPELLLTALAAYITRNLGLAPLSAVLILTLVVYVAVKSLREKYYPPSKVINQ